MYNSKTVNTALLQFRDRLSNAERLEAFKSLRFPKEVYPIILEFSKLLDKETCVQLVVDYVGLIFFAGLRVYGGDNTCSKDRGVADSKVVLTDAGIDLLARLGPRFVVEVLELRDRMNSRIEQEGFNLESERRHFVRSAVDLAGTFEAAFNTQNSPYHCGDKDLWEPVLRQLSSCILSTAIGLSKLKSHAADIAEPYLRD